MSKILIDLSILKDVIDDFRYARDTATDRDDFKRFSDQVEQLESVMKDQKRFSVLEWHPVSEKPKIGSQIIVRLASGMYELDMYGKILEGNMLDQFDLSSIIEWAYLPE